MQTGREREGGGKIEGRKQREEVGKIMHIEFQLSFSSFDSIISHHRRKFQISTNLLSRNIELVKIKICASPP